MVPRWRLLDRPVEFHSVRAALTRGEVGGVVLAGAVGVGKTTLARTVTASLRADVHWLACTDSSRGIPLGVFADRVPASRSRDPVALLSAARGSILANPAPVIGVDDAHLLDHLSATLLHQIAVERVGRIVTTVRDGEPIPDLITSLWEDGHLLYLQLAALTRLQCVSLVEAVLGGPLDGPSAEVMWEGSCGNPLFLRHMVEDAVDAQTLTEVDGVWRLHADAVAPSGLAALLDERLAHVEGNVADALGVLALCEPLDMDVLCELCGDDAIDGAEDQDMIRVVYDGPVMNARFSHPFYGEVVRRHLGTASARRLRGCLIEVLRDTAADSAAGRLRLAQLSVDCDHTVDADFLISAAKDALFLSNLPLGEDLARAAFERGGGVQAAELLSRALLWQGHPAEANRVLAQFDPAQMEELELLQWGLPRMSILFWSMGEVDHANGVLALLRRRVGEDPSLKLVVEAAGSTIAVHENKIKQGIVVAQAVLSEPGAPTQAIDFAAFSAGLAMPVAGRGLSFEPYAVRCRAKQNATDGMIRVMVRYCDVLALTYTGQLDLADKRAAGYTEFSSAGEVLGSATAKIAAGLVATHRGNFPHAIASIEQALTAQAEQHLPWQLPARLLLAKSYAALGDTGRAGHVLADAGKHAGPFTALHEPQQFIAQSWLAAATGGHRSAICLARRAADVAHQAGQFAVEAEALHHAARFGDGGAARRLELLTDRVDGPLAGLYAQHAIAVAGSNAIALDSLSSAFEDAGLMLSAADSAAQAVPLYGRACRRRESGESADRASHLAQRCGGAATPAIRSAAEHLR